MSRKPEGAADAGTSTAIRGRADGHLGRARNLARIAGLFMLIGPPVGGAFTLVWLIGMALIMGKWVGGLVGLLQVVPLATVAAVPLSYLFGVLPAALAGLLVGVGEIVFGRVPWAIVLLIGAAAGAFDAVVDAKLMSLLPAPFFVEQEIEPEPPMVSPVLFSALKYYCTCMIATFACWRVVRNCYTAPLPAHGGLDA